VRQYNRETPYRVDNERSKRAKMQPPRDLLGWFMTEFRKEVPDRLHTRGVWRDAHRRGDAEFYDPVGGSALGAPRMADPFRAYIEDDAFGTQPDEYEGHKSLANHYRTPVRAALARLAGRRENGHGYLMARALYILARTDGDIDQAFGGLHAFTKNEAGEVVHDPDGERVYRMVMVQTALRDLYYRYEEEPPNHTVRSEDKAA
jgi:hypothetical protein